VAVHDSFPDNVVYSLGRSLGIGMIFGYHGQAIDLDLVLFERERESRKR
jgi:hypothetical protein